MTESDILRIWNGPTSQCNKAKLLKFAADLESRIRAESAQEPVATLHDDGCFTWKRKPAPHESQYAGWRMEVYAAPVAKPAAQETVPREKDLLSITRLFNPDGWCVHYKDRKVQYHYDMSLEDAMLAASKEPKT